MTGATLDAPGVDRFAASVDAAGRDLVDLTDVNRAEGRAALAAARIPVLTGELRDSAYVEADASGFALSATAAHAGIVHARDPFFTRAVGDRTDEILDALGTHAEGVLDTITGG